ncbi:MAG: CHASE domain-containing protein [Phycisphaerales bacterium]|nr:CHASE domain-containing protein [Phycisphaerales bacterium]
MDNSQWHPGRRASDRGGLASRWRGICARYWVVIFVVCAGFGVSWSSYRSYAHAAQTQRERASLVHAQQQHEHLIGLFDGYEQALKYMRGYVQSSEYVDQDEWSGFVKYADLEARFPGVWGFAYVERVRAGELDRFIEDMHAQGHDSFVVKTHSGELVQVDEQDDRDRFVIKYEEPIERNRAVIGLDVSSSETNKEVYDSATDSGEARLSDPFPLGQQKGDPGAVGIVMVMPVFDSRLAVETVEDRRRAVTGWVSVALDMGYFRAKALDLPDDTERITLQIETQNGHGVELLSYTRNMGSLHDDCGAGCEEDAQVQGTFATEFAGKSLSSTIVINSMHVPSSLTGAEYDENMRKAESSLYLGIRLTLIVIVVTLVIEFVRIRAERIAGRMTSTLRQSERRQRAFAYHAQLANKAKSKFLANMSHEMRSPMSSVLGYTEVLHEMLDEGATADDMREAVGRIERAGSHLLMVVNDVLDLSKIESGKLPVNKVACEIGEILSEVVGTMGIKAEEAGLELGVRFETEVPRRIVADPYRVRQILLNLVGNAIKFTKEGGVRLAVGCNEGRIWVSVHDTGVGMRSDRIEGLFEPFEQDHLSKEYSYNGTGLGLSISRQLAEMMDGELTATSVLGEGSVFTCTLPLEIPEEDVVDGSAEWGGVAMIHELPCRVRFESGEGLLEDIGGRVLVVEDGEDNQRLIGHYLRKAGVAAEFVYNGLEAVEMIEADPAFDLIVMDMQMPVMDGYEATRTLRDRGCRIPILALTANAMSDDRQRCIDAGCDEYETKPVKRARLLRTVARMMGRGADGGKRAA